MKDCVLLMTGTINVGNTCYVEMKNSRERLFQYLCSLVSWITLTKQKKIVFCENSNTDYDFTKIKELAEKYEKQLEILVFDGNQQSAFYGKGYGEGKIIEYAFDNSRFLQEEICFYKITGSTFVENFDQIYDVHENINNVFYIVYKADKYTLLEKNPIDLFFDKYFQEKKTLEKLKLMKRSFQKYLFHLKHQQWKGRPNIKGKVSTRFFKSNTTFFRANLLTSYKKVNDRWGYYIKKVYYDDLMKQAISPFLEKYILVGKSGSSGNLIQGIDYSEDIRKIAKSFVI